MRARILVVTCLLGIIGSLGLMRGSISTPAYTSFDTFPAVLGKWQLVASANMTTEELGQLQLTDYMLRRYATKEGKTVDLYVGFHGGGKETGPVHSPRNCLPGSGWAAERSDIQSFSTPDGKQVELVRALYSKGSQSLWFYYWFDVQGKTYTEEYELKLAELYGALVKGRRDAILIRVSAPVSGDDQNDDALVQDFVKQFYPILRQHVPV